MDPEDFEDLDEYSDLTFEEILEILQEELESSEERYVPLNFNDDYRGL